MRYKRFLLIGSFLMLAFAMPAAAQYQLDIFEKELPVYDLVPAEAFAAQGRAYSKLPFRDKDLEFEIVLPKEWVEGKSFGYSLSKHVPVEAGKYTGPVKFNMARSYVAVQAQELDYQTSAVEWFTSYILKNGFSIMGAKEHGPNLIEAVHVELKDGQTYVVRTLTMINGAKLVQVAYSLPSEAWADERALQNQVMHSFKLKNAVQASMEPVESYEFLDIMAFDYPETWQFTPPKQKSLDTMVAEFKNYDSLLIGGQKKILNGRIQMKMFSEFAADSVAQTMVDRLDGLSKRGFVIQGAIEQDDIFRLSRDVSTSRLEVYDVLDAGYPNRKTELWVLGMEAQGYYYVVSLITPARAAEFGAWTRNTEAMKIILGSFEPVVGQDE